jgi:metal-responsive CopG/Arc/MetJ family transcriptional regulator
MSRTKIPPEKVQIPVSFKLPRELLAEIDAYVEKHPREGCRSEFIKNVLKEKLNKAEG